MENFKLIEIYSEDVGCYRSYLVNRFKRKSLNVLIFLIVSTIITGIPISNAKTVPEVAKACLGWLSIAFVTWVHGGLMYQTSNFYKLIDETREIIQKRMERPDLKLSYEKMNKKNQKFVKLMHTYLLVNTVTPAIVLLVYKVFIYFTREMESDDYILLSPIWLPFDYKTSLLTYLFAFALEILIIFTLAKVGCPIMGIMVEMFLILCEFSEDIKREITAMNKNWEMNQNQVEMMQKLTETIRFIANYNECIRRLNQIFEPLIINNLLYSLLTICISFLLLHFELSNETPNYGVAAVAIAQMTMSFGLISVFCEVGEQLESRSSDIDDAICELDWNTFPIRVQKMMPMILLSTQNQIQLTAYGGILCSRNTFKKVVNTSYSYFTVFSG